MLLLKDKFIKYLQVGTSRYLDSERNRTIFMVNLFSFVGSSITGALALMALLDSNYLLSSVLIVSSVSFYLGRFLQLANYSSYLSSAVILFSLYILMFYLVQSGGVNNTGPLWIFIVAPVTFFIKGLKYGLVSLLCFIFVILILLFYKDGQLLSTEYSTDFKLRLIYSFATTSFLSAYYEYSRQQSYDHLQQLSKRYKRLARIDPLTGLSNRRDALAALNYEQMRMARDKQQLAIILCDIDFFKRINDSLGHDAGDKVLIELSKLFENLGRNQDLVARWGGEEFLFMLPATQLEGALHFAESIHQSLAKKVITYQEHEINLTVSLGVAILDNDTDIKSAISEADSNLYKAKYAGRNQTWHSNKVT